MYPETKVTKESNLQQKIESFHLFFGNKGITILTIERITLQDHNKRETSPDVHMPHQN